MIHAYVLAGTYFKLRLHEGHCAMPALRIVCVLFEARLGLVCHLRAFQVIHSRMFDPSLVSCCEYLGITSVAEVYGLQLE